MADSHDLKLTSRVRRKADLPWKQLNDTVVILDLTSGDFLELDEVGGWIWTALDGARTLAEHAQALADEYAVSTDTAGSDVMAFVGDLCVKGLVERVG